MRLFIARNSFFTPSNPIISINSSSGLLSALSNLLRYSHSPLALPGSTESPLSELSGPGAFFDRSDGTDDWADLLARRLFSLLLLLNS